MRINRVLRAGVVLAVLGCLGLATLPGCGDDTPPSGGQVKVDPVETAKRAEKISELYKTNPPSKGPGGQLPAMPPQKRRLLLPAKRRSERSPEHRTMTPLGSRTPLRSSVGCRQFGVSRKSAYGGIRVDRRCTS